jgi:chromosome segregation ATPase
MELNLLNELDDRVEALLKQLQQLEREKEQLMKRLVERELHFGEASARLREYDEFRSRFKMVIESMLARFDGLNLD